MGLFMKLVRLCFKPALLDSFRKKASWLRITKAFILILAA
jgi:hypothetical protein